MSTALSCRGPLCLVGERPSNLLRHQCDWHAGAPGSRARLRVGIGNPSAPVGHRDVKPTPTGQVIVDFMKRRMPAYIETGMNLVDVDDVAMGHALAMEKGRIGERYILGNQNLRLYEVF